MKKTIILKCLNPCKICLILILLIYNSCRKDSDVERQSPGSISQSSLVGESRLLFNQGIAKRPALVNDGRLRHQVSKTPLWDQAEQVTLSVGPALKVPLAYQQKVFIEIGRNQEQVPLSELSYLLIYKDRNQLQHAEVVTQIPDDTYWTHRNEPGRKFSGIIIVEDWWGRPIKTFKKTPQQQIIKLGSPVMAFRRPQRQNLHAEAEDCDVVVTTGDNGMYNVELICSSGGGGGGDSGDGGGWGFPEFPSGNGGGQDGPGRDYDNLPHGGGGGGTGPVNNNPPPRGQENIIHNQVQNPYLRSLVNQAISTDIDDMISRIITTLDEDIFVQISVIDAPETTHLEAAETDLIKIPNSNTITGTITLSTNVLSISTKEYAVTTVIHEFIHSYLKYIGQSNRLRELEHEQMAIKYINPMVHYLTTAFGLTSRDATALCWIGVNDASSYENSTDFSYPGGSITKSELEDIYRDYVSGRLGESICSPGNLE